MTCYANISLDIDNPLFLEQSERIQLIIPSFGLSLPIEQTTGLYTNNINMPFFKKVYQTVTAIGPYKKREAEKPKAVDTVKEYTQLPTTPVPKEPVVPKDCSATGIFMLGPPKRNLGQIKLCGITKDQEQILLSMKQPGEKTVTALYFGFTKWCRAADCSVAFKRLPSRHFSGFVEALPYNRIQIQTLADQLKTMKAAIVGPGDRTIIIWPARTRSWAWLDRQLAEVPENCVLRFLVYFHAAPDVNRIGRVVRKLEGSGLVDEEEDREEEARPSDNDSYGHVFDEEALSVTEMF